MTTLTQNVGFIDRLVRGLLAIDLLALCLLAYISGLTSLLAIGLVVYLSYSGLTGHCPLYAAFGQDTRQRTEP